MQSIDGRESFLKVYLVNGNSNQIRFNELTDIELIINLLTNRLSSDSNDRPLKSLFSIRVIKFPENKDAFNNEDLSEIIWLDNCATINDLIKKFKLNLDKCRFELRIRYFPFNFKEILDQDRVTFYYLYDQIKNDYFQTKKTIDQDTAINLCCLEIRRFFKDISQFALDKKSNYDCLEKEIGLFKFLHSSIISSVKPKVLRKLIQNQFKKVLNLDEVQCMIKFLDIVDEIIHFKIEVYNCEFKIFIHYLPVKLVIGNEVGISYTSDSTSTPTQMACFQQIEHFQTLLKNPEDFKNFEYTLDFIHNKKCVLQLKIFGADELLAIICPSLIVIENISLLIDGYCRLQLKKTDSLWVNKYNCFRPKELFIEQDNAKNTQQKLLKKQPIYDNEEKDYAEIVEDDYDYSVPNNSKFNYVDRSHVKMLNLIGNGQFGQVYKGIYKDGEKEIEVAIKTCKEDDIGNRFLEEAYIMQQFEHKHIIKLIGICSSPILILMELALGELKQYLQTNKSTIDLSELILYSYQLSTALSYLESKNYVHRDLALRNVLICSDSIVKLADFGLSRWMAADSSYYKASNCKLPIKWMSPEAINFRRFSKSSDVWGFAVMCWEILSFGTKPFDKVKNSVVIHKIENGERLPLPQICPPNLYNLLLHCWKYDPNERPTINQIENFLYELLKSTSLDNVKDKKSNGELKNENKELFDDEFKKSLMEIKLESQKKQSIEDAVWLENEEKVMFGSCILNTSSDNQSETTSLSSTNDNLSNSSKNPFLDSLDNSNLEKSDTLQNLNGLNSSSPSQSSSMELNRDDDKVYMFTRNVLINVDQLFNSVKSGRVELYYERIKNIGIELRNLLQSVDNLIVNLPEWSHNEINLAHSILSKNFDNLIESMKQARKYHMTTVENDFKKKLFESAYVLAKNCKNLLDVCDKVRLKTNSNQQSSNQVLI